MCLSAGGVQRLQEHILIAAFYCEPPAAGAWRNSERQFMFFSCTSVRLSVRRKVSSIAVAFSVGNGDRCTEL